MPMTEAVRARTSSPGSNLRTFDDYPQVDRSFTRRGPVLGLKRSGWKSSKAGALSACLRVPIEFRWYIAMTSSALPDGKIAQCL